MKDKWSVFQRVCDLIQVGMKLSDDQIFLWDQKIDIPPDRRLYIAVGVQNSKPFGVSRRYVPSGGGLTELVSVNMLANLSIDIMSTGPDARDRKEEILLSLSNTYSQQQQNKYSFYVAPLTNSFVNLSEVEGAAIPYRFNLSVNVQYFIQTTNGVEYYDTFTDTVITNQ